jgi:hypothetical protein
MAISHDFDNIFDTFRESVPLSFLRALAFTQSRMNPNKSVQGSAGLFMISGPALEAFDRVYPDFQPTGAGRHRLTDLADPVLNTAVAVWVIKNIIGYFNTRYPKTLSTNWNSTTFVALVAHGFNVGYSEPRGIGAAIKIIEDTSPDTMSIEEVARVAREIGLGERKYKERDVSRAKTIANLYVADLGGVAVEVGPPIVHTAGSGGLGLIAVLAGIPIIGLMLAKKKK